MIDIESEPQTNEIINLSCSLIMVLIVACCVAITIGLFKLVFTL